MAFPEERINGIGYSGCIS